MNTFTREPLDSFDTALLARLQQQVATPVRRTGHRRVLGLAGVAAAGAATIVGVTSLGSSTAAYAVDRTSGGDITITIHQLSDARGLQQDLASYGIKADVNYQAMSVGGVPAGSLHFGSGAAGGGVGSGVQSSASSSASSGASSNETPPADACGDPSRPPLTAQMKSDDYVITIPSNSPLHQADSELKITTTGDLNRSVAGITVGYSVHGAQCGMGSVSASAVPAH